MGKYILTEVLKTKQTTIRKMTMLVPGICFILATGFCALGGAEILLLTDITIVNHWGLVWLPALVALLCGLSIKQEKKAGEFKMIFGSPVKAVFVWAAKCITIAGITLAATLILWIFISVFDLAFIHNTAKLGNVLGALLMSWLGALWQIPIYLFLAQKMSYFLLLIINCGLSITIAPIYSVKGNWWTIPWAWVLRFQAPILALHPNGIPLESNSMLLRYDGFPQAIVLGILVLGTAVCLTALLFKGSRGR